MKIPKFMAWDKSLKIMRNVKYIDFENQELMICADEYYDDGNTPNLDIVRKFDEFEIMQSTGVKDKNGVEIFEGDVLTDEGSFGHDWWDYATIEFDDVYYTYCISWIIEGINENITCCENYSIAGNIYENKDLFTEYRFVEEVEE